MWLDAGGETCGALAQDVKDVLKVFWISVEEVRAVKIRLPSIPDDSLPSPTNRSFRRQSAQTTALNARTSNILPGHAPRVVSEVTKMAPPTFSLIMVMLCNSRPKIYIHPLQLSRSGQFLASALLFHPLSVFFAPMPKV